MQKVKIKNRLKRTISAGRIVHSIASSDVLRRGRENTIGRYFEEFTVGETIFHKASKTIFESDNNFFSLLTMNHHPLHINIDYAANSQQGQIVVVGTLVFSLVVGLSVPDISGKAIANLEYESISHVAPVFVNDTIYARSKVLECLPSKSKPDRGIVFVETTGYNQDSLAVIRFRRRTLVMRRKI